MHLKSGLISYAFPVSIMQELAQYDIIISDSCTCTSDPNPEDPNNPNVCIEDRWGTEFSNSLRTAESHAWYHPMWGQGLPSMYTYLESSYNTYGNLGKVAIIIAGNDMWWGANTCKEYLDKIHVWKPTIYIVLYPRMNS